MNYNPRARKESKFRNLKSLAIGGFLGACNIGISQGAFAINIGVTANFGNDLANATALAAIHGGSSSATLLNSGTFNSLTTNQLVGSFDLLVVAWNTDPSYNLTWTTVILPYLNAGGTVIWEDPNNLSELTAGSGITQAATATLAGYTGEFGSNSFTSPHFAVAIGSGPWTQVAGSTTPGVSNIVKGVFGNGSIIVSGPDEFYHDPTSDSQNLLYLDSQVTYLHSNSSLSPVPEVGSALLATASIGLLAFRRKRTHNKIVFPR